MRRTVVVLCVLLFAACEVRREQVAERGKSTSDPDERGIPSEDVKTFGGTLTKAGKLADIKLYDGAGHGFMNPNNKEGYDAAATQDAWRRIDRFFDSTLRAKIPNS